MKKLENKITVITGGNSGIGLATAHLFKSEGAKVIITARSKETFEATKNEFGDGFDVIQTDVRHISEIENLYDHVKLKYGKIDVLFANAGVAYFLPTDNVDENIFDNQFDTNVKGIYFTVAKAIPLISGEGKIILNSSSAATKGFPGSSVYSATKAAIRSFARTWAAELAPRDIRVNVVSPGPTETPIFSKLKLTEEQLKDFSATLLNSVPLHRFGSADEIAKAVLFLASDDSSFVTGANLIADGGLSQI